MKRLKTHSMLLLAIISIGLMGCATSGDYYSLDNLFQNPYLRDLFFQELYSQKPLVQTQNQFQLMQEHILHESIRQELARQRPSFKVEHVRLSPVIPQEQNIDFSPIYIQTPVPNIRTDVPPVPRNPPSIK